MFRRPGDRTHRFAMDIPRRLDPIALEQHGLVTRAQAEAVGISAATWYRALQAGLLEAVHPNVARLYGSAATREQRILAAALCAGAGAMASHRSAAHLWGVPRPDDDPIEILMNVRKHHHRITGVTVHRPRDERDLKLVRRDGIATTNILRTLCDLGAVDAQAVPGAVGHVVTTKLATPAALRRAVRTHGRRGRPGVPALRDALEHWVIDDKPADSVLEPAMRDLVRRERLPAVDFHPRLLGYEVDFLVRGSRLVLECDGWTYHGLDRRNWERDKVRDGELTAAGYIIVRFSYHQIVREPAALADRIRGNVRQWCPELLVTDRRNR